MTATTASSPSPAPQLSSEDVTQRVRQVVVAALDRKAVELRVLRLSDVTDFTDYFVVCSGTNERQVQAIADAVDEALRKDGVRPLHVEGYRHARWVLLDYGDFLVHVFSQEQRAFYALERLWGDAPDVTRELSE